MEHSLFGEELDPFLEPLVVAQLNETRQHLPDALLVSHAAFVIHARVTVLFGLFDRRQNNSMRIVLNDDSEDKKPSPSLLSPFIPHDPIIFMNHQ